jgi:UDP-N-acetylglucosamine--N-acetylmuramyl-(pentapeptide) pyrophosphoryl-undecaprenol N-acetylglucosamine transferase
MKVLFTCGGTAGHINPAVAVAKLIKDRRPTSEILFSGATGGMETELVRREGFDIVTVNVSNFRRSFKPKDIRNNAKTLFGILGAIRQAKEHILRFRPDVVVGTGGYASFPVIYAAAALKIPSAIHESNAIPGLTTSLLAKKADKIMVGFSGGAEHYKNKEKVVVTGTPVREGFIYKSKAEAKQELGITDRPLVLSYWGSLGAREMNKCIAEFIKYESAEEGFHHIHATGSFGWKWMPEYISEMGIDLTKHRHIDMREYIYDMPTVMAAADLVICRGGASTLNEALASATPAIIVPSPNVAENHQEKNARALEKEGAVKVIPEKECSGERLYKEAALLIGSPEKLEYMSGKLRGMAVLDAGERIYQVICSLVSQNI